MKDSAPTIRLGIAWASAPIDGALGNTQTASTCLFQDDIRDNASLQQPYIILHTSLNSEMSLSYANQVGANEALTKFDAEELLQAMLRGAAQAG